MIDESNLFIKYKDLKKTIIYTRVHIIFTT